MANRVFSTHMQDANRQFLDDKQSSENNLALSINTALLTTALTHRSYLNEPEGSRAESNDRLETLGDSVIQPVITHTLYELDATLDEGQLTLIRSRVVSNETLARVGRNLSLGDFLRMGKGERQSGGANKASNLAGAFEALVGAIFLGANPFINNSQNPLGDTTLSIDGSPHYAAAAKFCMLALNDEIADAYQAVTTQPPKPKAKHRNGKSNQPAKSKQRGKDKPAAKNSLAQKQPAKKQSAKSAGPNINGKHPKSALQEITQAKYGALPEYRVIQSKGKSNAPTFNVEVSFNGKTMSKGSGAGKKAAETAAAKQALRALGAL